MSRRSVGKQRTSATYQIKVDQVRAWYEKLLKDRELEVINPNTGKVKTRKELKSIEYYLDQIKKPV